MKAHPHTRFFSTEPATTEIYTLSLHDALPICPADAPTDDISGEHVDDERHINKPGPCRDIGKIRDPQPVGRSEEHTSELQSHHDLVCRLLLEKKKIHTHTLTLSLY